MTPDEAKKAISRGEGQRTEFKQGFAEENNAIESLCAFTHADGGTVFFGVRDGGRPSGVDLGRNTIENFANSVRRHTSPPLSPSIEELCVESKLIVAASVPKALDDQLFYAFGRPYVRVGKTNQVMSPEQQRARLQAAPGPSANPPVFRLNRVSHCDSVREA